jgi:hypothetical protein
MANLRNASIKSDIQSKLREISVLGEVRRYLNGSMDKDGIPSVDSINKAKDLLTNDESIHLFPGEAKRVVNSFVIERLKIGRNDEGSIDAAVDMIDIFGYNVQETSDLIKEAFNLEEYSIRR